MTTKFDEFWNFIDGRLCYKIDELFYIRYSPDLNEDYPEMEANPSAFCEKFLYCELKKISEMFSIEKSSAFILASFLLIYFDNIDGFTLYFLGAKELAASIALQPLEIMKYSSAFDELEEKNIINITNYDYEFAREISLVDRRLYDHYSVRKDSSPIALFNKTFELTESFIKKIQSL